VAPPDLGQRVFPTSRVVLDPYEPALVNMTKAGVPQSWLPTLATLKAAGVPGLLIGIAVPPIGTAAAIGVIPFFVGVHSAAARPETKHCVPS
jgi:DoxX-like family